jgi:uncharacterized protein (DUF488 family)
MTSIYTVGHSLHSVEHFVGLLRPHAIARLVDVRSHPVSKRAPQFRKEALAAALAAHEVEYVFLGHLLGGRPADAEVYRPDGSVDYARRSLAADFVSGIERLVSLAAAVRAVILCDEEDPSHCHRERLVAVALRQRGLSLRHIRGDGGLEPDAEQTGGSARKTGQLALFG